MSEGARAHYFFLDITFHSLYTFNQLQQNTVAIHEKWKGRIDSWQPRRKPRRKRNTKHEQQHKRGRGKRPLSFCARCLMRHHPMALQRHSERREGSAVQLLARDMRLPLHRLQALLRCRTEVPVGTEVAIEAWLRIESTCGYVLRYFFNLQFCFVQLQFAASRDYGSVLFKIVEDQPLGPISPLLTCSQGVN